MAAEGGGLIPPTKLHNATLRKETRKMTKCNIDFGREIVEGSLGTKEEVKEFLRTLNKRYDYEGRQRIRNREQHKWEYVIVYSFADYFFGTGFVCYKVA